MSVGQSTEAIDPQMHNTHLISDSKSFSRSFSIWLGRAAISHNIFGKHESRSVSAIFVLLVGDLVKVILLPKPPSSSSITSWDVNFRILLLIMRLASSLSSSSSPIPNASRAANSFPVFRYLDHLSAAVPDIDSEIDSANNTYRVRHHYLK